MAAALTAAQSGLRALDVETQRELRELFEGGAQDIARLIRAHAGADGAVPPLAVPALVGGIELRLARLRDEQQKLIEKSLESAAGNGAQVIDVLREAGRKGAIPAAAIGRLPDAASAAHEVLQTVLHSLAEDGLNLSDRLWRNYQALRGQLLPMVQQAVLSGVSARDAARAAVSAGGVASEDLLNQIELARAGVLGDAAADLLASDEAQALSNALRVFRTEMDRANILASRAAIYNTEGAVGTRFLLSPNHPRYDVCDVHASVNLYGLGAGVYPPGASPLPAHPNTLSYEEAVFEWEVTEKDREGREDLMEFLGGRSDAELRGVLQSAEKVKALRQGLLEFGEITLPWRELEAKYGPQLAP